jgi:hypothetical protein
VLSESRSDAMPSPFAALIDILSKNATGVKPPPFASANDALPVTTNDGKVSLASETSSMNL